MGNFKKIGLCCLFLSFCFLSFAKQISFQIVQHDNSKEEISEASYTVEDEILNRFFNSGYIVTNSAAEVSASEENDETLWKKGLGEAFDGGSDYFVQIKLYYVSEEDSLKSDPNLTKVYWNLAKAGTGVVISDETLTKIKKGNNGKDDLPSLCKEIVLKIINSIKINKA